MTLDKTNAPGGTTKAGIEHGARGSHFLDPDSRQGDTGVKLNFPNFLYCAAKIVKRYIFKFIVVATCTQIETGQP